MEQNTTPAHSLAWVVDQHRQANQMSWRQLAEASAIPPSTLSRFSRGGADLTTTQIERLAAALRIGKASALLALAEDVAA